MQTALVSTAFYPLDVGSMHLVFVDMQENEEGTLRCHFSPEESSILCDLHSLSNAGNNDK